MAVKSITVTNDGCGQISLIMENVGSIEETVLLLANGMDYARDQHDKAMMRQLDRTPQGGEV